MRKRLKKASTFTAAEWNERYPVGTPVRFFPVLPGTDFEESKTRSEAWELGHGEPVVKIEGRAGGVCLSHCEPSMKGEA